jgi:hypothetical protein
MPRIINRVRLPFHPLLGRNVNHDSESRRYRVTAPSDTPIASVTHDRHVPVFDQGQLGSCTGNAGVGCTGTGHFYETLADTNIRFPWDEAGAVMLYGRATALDPYAGTYPPDDTGSDGLSVAKALKEAGEISGYQWAFTPNEARAALMTAPEITGIPWMQDMFNPTADGQVKPTGGLAGGHEIVVSGYRLLGTSPSNDDQVWFTNSWGPSWGAAGRFWMRFGDWSDLLAQDGDVTQFVPATAPAPTPTPDPNSDEDAAGDTLWSATMHWSSESHTGGNKAAARAVKAWAKATGRA